MAIYAIGDVHGCYDELCTLLDIIKFDQVKDSLWFVGDLVNRGPNSLQTLRLIKSLGSQVKVVLGNHDLYLLHVAYNHLPCKQKDTLDDILQAHDRDELLEWLRQQPLSYVNDDFILVHAGVLPTWSLEDLIQNSEEIHQALMFKPTASLLKHIWGDKPNKWTAKLKGKSRQRCILNALTRLRFCNSDGSMDLEYKLSLTKAPKGIFPWFKHPSRLLYNKTIIFGHWAALGLYFGDGVICLDSGCIWGGALTAYSLEDHRLFQAPSRRFS